MNVKCINVMIVKKTQYKNNKNTTIATKHHSDVNRIIKAPEMWSPRSVSARIFLVLNEASLENIVNVAIEYFRI